MKSGRSAHRRGPAHAEARPLHAVGPDENLIRLAAGRQEWAFAELYDRHGTDALGLAIRVTGERVSADKAVERAFLAAWSSAERYDGRSGTVRAWLLAFVHREAIAIVRGGEIATEHQPSIGWREPFGRLERTTVRRAFGALSPAQREAVESAYFGRFGPGEAAGRTRVSLAALRDDAASGLRTFREALTAEVDVGALSPAPVRP